MWHKLTINTTALHSDLLSDCLDEVGAIAITLTAAGQEELFEPAPDTTPLWQETQLAALFTEETDMQQVLAQLSQVLAPQALPSYQLETVPEQNWQQACEQAFQPVCFANRLWIYPSWCDRPSTTEPCILLDPGLAFGTGAHPTTALCLEWLATTLTPQQHVIDYGCGSGILAIAALALGAASCWAVDLDPQALEATRENARRNAIADTQLPTILPAELPALQVDVVIANILANPLVELAPQLSALLKPGGTIVLSGLLSHQTAMVMAAYASEFMFLPPKHQDEWALLVGQKIKAPCRFEWVK